MVGIVKHGAVVHPGKVVFEQPGPVLFLQRLPRGTRTFVPVIYLLESQLLLGDLCHVMEDYSRLLHFIMREGMYCGDILGLQCAMWIRRAQYRWLMRRPRCAGRPAPSSYPFLSGVLRIVV